MLDMAYIRLILLVALSFIAFSSGDEKPVVELWVAAEAPGCGQPTDKT
jgi:hypothetical protein